MLTKSSIAFLLNPVDASPPAKQDHEGSALDRVEAALSVLSRHRKRPSLQSGMSPLASRALSASGVEPRRLALDSPHSCGSASDASCIPTSTCVSKPRRKRIRVRKPTPCTTPDCGNFAVTKGACVRHGGGARCEVDSCEKRAKKNKRCFTHGGNSQCQHEGCESKSKRYGYCWAHGGGITCAADDCEKVAAQGGYCWAHGGGSRCRVENCTRRSYQKHEYYCSAHYKR